MTENEHDRRIAEHLAGKCPWCGQFNLIQPMGPVPDVDDNYMWEEIIYDHKPDCEWVLTRAHRLPYTYSPLH